MWWTPAKKALNNLKQEHAYWTKCHIFSYRCRSIITRERAKTIISKECRALSRDLVRIARTGEVVAIDGMLTSSRRIKKLNAEINSGGL